MSSSISTIRPARTAVNWSHPGRSATIWAVWLQHNGVGEKYQVGVGVHQVLVAQLRVAESAAVGIGGIGDVGEGRTWSTPGR